jgi:hypothetical protein
VFLPLELESSDIVPVISDDAFRAMS